MSRQPTAPASLPFQQMALRTLPSAAGRIAAVTAFTAMLSMTGQPAWPAVGLALLLTSFLPDHRRAILAIATIAVVFVSPPLDLETLADLAVARGAETWLPAWPLAVATVLALACGYVHLVRAHPRTVVGRRPVACLLATLTVLFVASAHLPLVGALWFATTAGAMVLSSYLWFFAYAASESKLQGAPHALAQLGYWRPFWGFSNVPLGKGAAYLERVEARNAEQLALTQLSGIRLMAWAVLLTLVMNALRFALYTPHDEWDGLAGIVLGWVPNQGLPRIADLLDAQSQGAPFPLFIRWASVVSEFAMSVLHMVTWGHPIIATCRMVGFQAAANTDRPLLSTSIVEFYNRFYFYFKELLATFFFYPTYLTYFRSMPRLRMFAATFAAAGVGNFLFHFFRDSQEIFRWGLWEAFLAYHVYGCYALVLGVTIGASQIRLAARGRKRLHGPRRVWATTVVVAFYCLVGVLDVRTTHSILEYLSLYRSLLGH